MHTKKSKIITQNFTEFFITFGKPHHPASKDTLARWVKEVMGNSGIDTEIFKPHSTKVASNSAAYKLGMLLQEVLKRGSGRMRVHSLHIILEKSRAGLT